MVKIVLIVAFVVSIFANKFRIPLIQNEGICMHQNIHQHVIVQIKTQAQVNVITQFFYGVEQLINCNGNICDKHLTTQKFGVYKLCIKNANPKLVKVKVLFVFGKDARDFSSNNHTDSITDLNAIAHYAQQFATQLQQDNNEGIVMALEEFKSPMRDYYQYFFSVIFIVSIIVLTLIQYKMIKRILTLRKYM